MQREEEMLARLINIEHKINLLCPASVKPLETPAGKPAWSGHADQAFGPYTYAQHGEDMIIANIFHRLKIETPDYIDIGAHHPLNVSNTALLHARGSRGINVEANPDLIEAFRQARPSDLNLNIGIGPKPGTLPFYRVDNWSGRNSFDLKTIEAFVAAYPNFKVMDAIQVPVMTLNACIDEYHGGKFPAFMSIDVEGLDFDILAGADFEHSKPVLLCVEVVSGSDNDQRAGIVSMLKDKGFEPVFETIGNVFLVDVSFKKHFVF